MRTCLAVFERGIGVLAVVAPCYGGDDLVFEFGMLNKRGFLCIPIPAVGQILRNDAGNFAELQRYRLNIGKRIFFCDFIDLLYYIGHNA